MYAVVVAGGKQYKVSEGDIFDTEKVMAEKGDKIELETIMVVDGDKVITGEDAKKVKVTAEVLSFGKGKKIIVFKYKAKKNVRKKQGHRQAFTRLKVVGIK